MAASTNLTPSQRSLRARKAAHTSWANTTDPAARTAAARAAQLDRFERQVDPEGVLDPATRARMAESAKKAFYAGLALKSAQVRRARRSAKGAPSTKDGTENAA